MKRFAGLLVPLVVLAAGCATTPPPEEIGGELPMEFQNVIAAEKFGAWAQSVGYTQAAGTLVVRTDRVEYAGKDKNIVISAEQILSVRRMQPAAQTVRWIVVEYRDAGSTKAIAFYPKLIFMNPGLEERMYAAVKYVYDALQH